MTAKLSNSNGADDFDPETEERDDAVIAKALRWSLAALLIGGAVVAGVVYVAWPEQVAKPVHETKLAEVAIRDTAAVPIPSVKFTDVTDEAGIAFRHQNAAHGEKLLPETMGGGCAFFDFDADGDQDLLLINGLSHWPWEKEAASGAPAVMALYRNDGTGKFDDVTADSGLDVSMYGMGVAVGDYDNDGHVDVYITAVGLNRLLHNEGDGKFADVTDAAGVAGAKDQWSTSSGWFDYDKDGDLDLFVCNYLAWSRAYDAGQNFQLTGGGRAYGRPQNFEGALPYLYRNEGGGRFTEVSKDAGLQMRNPNTNVPMAKSLGVVFEDVDQDGWIDIVVANDTVQNFLFHNEGNGKFREIGAFTGIAFDMNGNARGAMGIDAARFRDDDSLGIAIGNFANEMTALYVAYSDQMQFMDEAVSTGLGPSSRLELKFGLFFWDFDLDGRLDIFTANGHLEEDINRVQPSQHYAQSPHLFWNCGATQNTEFLAVTAEHCGEDMMKPIVGRGAAYADVDNDGDLDVLMTGIAEQPRLLRNDQQQKNHWLRFKLTGSGDNRDAIGALVDVELKDRVLHRQVSPTRSYLSQVELPVSFGLGGEAKVERVTIRWPDGSKQVVPVDEVDRTYEVTQSSSAPAIERDANWQPSAELEQAALAGLKTALPGMPSLPRESSPTTCGWYLHAAGDAPGRAAMRESESKPLAPCHGPFCSDSPPVERAPIPTMVHVPKDSLGPAAVGIGMSVHPETASSFVVTSEIATPGCIHGSIFRPPDVV